MFPTSLTDPDTAVDAPTPSPGGLLKDLERRQDEALELLDDLEAKIASVLKGLGVEAETDDDTA